MPYIKQEKRPRLKEIAKKFLEENDKEPFSDGDINYFFSLITFNLFERNPRYSEINRLKGVLKGVYDEFHERKVKDYEKKKALENGDVEIFLPEIKDKYYIGVDVNSGKILSIGNTEQRAKENALFLFNKTELKIIECSEELYASLRYSGNQNEDWYINQHGKADLVPF